MIRVSHYVSPNRGSSHCRGWVSVSPWSYPLATHVPIVTSVEVKSNTDPITVTRLLFQNTVRSRCEMFQSTLMNYYINCYFIEHKEILFTVFSLSLSLCVCVNKWYTLTFSGHALSDVESLFSVSGKVLQQTHIT